MGHTTDISRGNTEILNFVISRIIFFKRIHYEMLLEVLNENFPDQNVEDLLSTLLKEGIVKIANEHLVVAKEAELTALFSLRRHSCEVAG